VLVLEDLHWGDLPSVRFVDSSLRALAERPFFVLALARPEVREVFPAIWAERSLEELRLGELSRKGAERLVRTVLGGRADDALVARLVERAAGNAFHLEELIRAVAEGKGDGDRDEIPETLLAVLASRLERLETDARRVLRAGSVFGRVFWRGGVFALLRGAERAHRFDAWLDELVEREVISRREVAKFEGEEEFAFRHALVREAAYALLTDDDRKLGHRLAGEWLERAGESEAVALAEHYERGGERASAIGWYRRAAEQALGGSDLPGAIERARRGIACGAEGEAFGALLRIQAEAHSWRGELAEAVQCALEALSVLPARSPGWFGAAEALAFSAGKLGSVAILAKLGEQLSASGEAALSAPEASACANTAFQLFYAGQYALAAGLLAMIERADPAVRRRDPVVLARIHQARSSRAMFAGDVGAYLEEEQQAAVAFEEAGDFRNSVMQRGHVAYACQVMGDYEAAERIHREVIDAGEKLGLTSVVATAKHNLGLVLAQCGAVGAGLRVEREALAAAHAQGDRRLEAGAREYIARILLIASEPVEAEAEVRQALELVTPSFKPLVLAVVAQTLLAQGRLDEALAEATLASRELDEIGEIEEGESMVRLTHAEALLALPPSPERRDEAARVVAGARDRLLSQAANISDFRRRAGFLEQVPENARLLRLADELGV
jgi:tetratricopeptide (TPR) repeat protein